MFPIGSYVIARPSQDYSRRTGEKTVKRPRLVGVVKSGPRRGVDLAPRIIEKNPKFAWTDVVKVAFPEDGSMSWVALDVLQPLDMPILTSRVP